jgi:hypothetical protein
MYGCVSGGLNSDRARSSFVLAQFHKSFGVVTSINTAALRTRANAVACHIRNFSEVHER